MSFHKKATQFIIEWLRFCYVLFNIPHHLFEIPLRSCHTIMDSPIPRPNRNLYAISWIIKGLDDQKHFF